MSDHHERYVLITPCRNEEKTARVTVESVLRQTALPYRWIIVDDGSSDSTPQILKAYADQYDWIEVVTRADRGDRKLGGGVIDAFYDGYEKIRALDYAYVCKLDLDLNLHPRYFESLIKEMQKDRRLGSCSGSSLVRRGGRLVPEPGSGDMSCGMSKFYRKKCFEDIGGFVREVMWDGIDCHKARLLGWRSRSFAGEFFSIEHLRPMGSSHKNIYRGRMRHGAGQYFMGTAPWYMLISSLYRMTHPPYVIGGAAILWGYILSYFGRKKRYGDSEFRAFLRRYHWLSLLKGRMKASQIQEKERDRMI